MVELGRDLRFPDEAFVQRFPLLRVEAGVETNALDRDEAIQERVLGLIDRAEGPRSEPIHDLVAASRNLFEGIGFARHADEAIGKKYAAPDEWKRLPEQGFSLVYPRAARGLARTIPQITAALIKCQVE
jgi:hypothetical protein